MSLLLYPRVPRPDGMTVWAGLADADAAGTTLHWTLDGAPAQPAGGPLRDVVPAGRAQRWEAGRAAVGLFRFDGLQADRRHRIGCELRAANGAPLQRAELAGRTLPRSIDGRWFNLLLGSCHHVDSADPAGIAATLERLRKAPTVDPTVGCADLSLLMGDQVYLDIADGRYSFWQFLQDYPDDAEGLRALFAWKYRKTWFGAGDLPGLRALLQFAPFATLADDHEQWNNYPHPQLQIGSTSSERGRRRWRDAANALYAAYQQPYLDEPLQPGHSQRIDVDGLSLFLLDTRLERTTQRLCTDRALQAAAQWVDALTPDMVAVFVAGQSLCVAPTGFAWQLKDAELADYRDDYERLLTLLARAPCPLICITGDVHYGRALRVHRRTATAGEPPIVEVICSPIAHYQGDQRGRASRRERRNPHLPRGAAFERHLQRPQPFALADGDAREFSNQLGLLSIRRDGGRAHAQLRLWPLRATLPITIADLFALPAPYQAVEK